MLNGSNIMLKQQMRSISSRKRARLNKHIYGLKTSSTIFKRRKFFQKRQLQLAKLNRELIDEVAQRKKLEQQLLHDINHDSLTHLPNRAMLMARLSHSVNHARRHRKNRFALLFIDLDRFKLVNDTFGHIEGDKILKETAERLSLCIRENDTLARIGGDEFVILLDTLTDTQDVKDIAQRILAQLAKPYEIKNQPFYTGGSIGISISGKTKTDTSESLLQQADFAMYQAKDKGKGCYVIFEHEAKCSSPEITELSTGLQHALSQKQLELNFLPIINLETKKIAAIEPQLYWQHPTLGKLNQQQLASMAKHCGLSTELDLYLITKLSHYHPKIELLYPYPIHLILSNHHLQHTSALEELIGHINISTIDNTQFWLFFDETAFLAEQSNDSIIKHRMTAFITLSACGANIGLSGFGRATSHISSLMLTPLQGLKLDLNYSNQLNIHQQKKFLKSQLIIAQTFSVELFITELTNAQLPLLQQLGFTHGQVETVEIDQVVAR